MKKYNYKLIISTDMIYQEVELSGEFEKEVYIGTTSQCAVRFGQEHYAKEFLVHVQKTKKAWQIICGDSVTLLSRGIFHQKTKLLKAGDKVEICFKGNRKPIMNISFFMDFDMADYDLQGYINIERLPSVSVGKKSYCNIVLPEESTGNNEFHIIRDAEGVKLQVIASDDGIFLNGFQVFDRIQKIAGKDFIMAEGYEFFLNGDKLYLSDVEGVQFNGVEFVEEKENKEYPHFHRTTRIKSILPEEKIEILSPKGMGKKPEKNLLMSLLPLLMSMVLMVGLRTVMGGGGFFVIYSAATMGLGIVTSILTYRNEGKEYRKEAAKREKQYLQYLNQREKYIRSAREKELRILNERHLCLEENIKQVEQFSEKLFEKGNTDEDYLEIRLGTGTIEAKSVISYKEPEYKETEDELVEYPAMIAEKYHFLADAPVCIDLKQIPCLGIVGKEHIYYQMLKNITFDLAVRHHYSDVRFYYFLPEEQQEKYSWIRWLRHVQNGVKRNIAYDENSRKVLLEELYGIFSEREGLKKEQCQGITNYIVFVCGEHGIAKHPLSKYIENCNRYGITFLFFQEAEHYLPKGCGKIVRLQEDEQCGMIINAEDKEQQTGFSYTAISEEKTQKTALRLGSIYVDEVSLEGGLTKNVSLYGLLHIANAKDLDLRHLWNSSKIYKSMAAPLGLKSGNEVVYLDLNEKKHGPHGLVAGTTGSGKSEILLSYILSMAVHFHPHEVGFVIIDFKGGGMANQLKNLPHLIGTITNIDGHEMERSLLSIKAELRKRQKLFAEAEVNHIDDYIQKYKLGKVETALPHLILIVDEFAELKTSQPEFMQELISAARIGRSLGVHLILATQKPTGVVNDQIWSNSKFKLCLKVQNKSDSNEILKSPLAAEIREPGRAYLQVGNNEIFELFQSAYSGEAADSMQVEKVHEYKVCEIGLEGKGRVIYEKKQSKHKQEKTQLEAVLEHIAEYCEKEQIEALPGICLPSLPDMISYEENNEKPKGEDIRVRIGIYDAPEQQLQEETYIDFTRENVFVLGSSQYGKTNFLSMLVKGLVSTYSPKQVNIYILDFASMVLKVFENLNHVGGVITSSEDDRLANFFKMMEKEIYKRKEILAQTGLSSYAAYLEAGYDELPQIIIMVDNLTVLKELYFQDNDRLLPICREGITVGISVVIANSQTSGIGFRYLSNFSRRIAFYCNNSGEYSSLFEHCRMQPAKIAGRGILELEKTIYEFQSYLAFAGEKEVERVKNMREFIEDINKCYQDYAAAIPQIPKVLDVKTMAQYAQSSEGAVAVGLDYETVTPLLLDLTRNFMWGFCGKEELGKERFLDYLLNVMKKQSITWYIFDDMAGRFSYMQKEGSVEYSIGNEKIKEILEQLCKTVEERKQLLYEKQKLDNEPVQLVIIQERSVLEEIQKNKEYLSFYTKLAEEGAAVKICFWITNMTCGQINYASPEPLKTVKEKKQIFLFDDIGEQKIVDVPMTFVRNNKKTLTEGDAYYCAGGDIRKVKTVTAEGK